MRYKTDPCSEVRTLKREQREAAILGIADRDWQVRQIPNGVVIGGVVSAEVQSSLNAACSPGYSQTVGIASWLTSFRLQHSSQ